LPRGVLLVVAIVKVVLPEVGTEAGKKEAVAPAGKPLAVKLTVPPKPPVGLTVTL
jgi:hypothetical protein